MKINIKEKFNLIEKLETLNESVKDHAEANSICSKGIYEFKKGVNPGLFGSFMNTLNAYNWISEVDGFINDYSKFINENQVGVQLEQILNSLDSSNHRATYQSAIDTLNELVPMKESKIKENLHKLKAFKFIPSLRVFLENYEKVEFAVSNSVKAIVEKEHVSPVMITESGYVFNLNGVNYETNSSLTSLKKFEGKVSGKFNYGLRALSMFNADAGEFVMETKNGYIKIVATDEGENRFFIGENEFFGKEAILTALNVTRVVDYFDKDVKSVLEFMFDNANEYAVIECVKSIKMANESFKTSFIKLANNKILLNTVNSFERTNEMTEITGDNFDSIVESFAKGYKLDIVPVLESIKVNLKAVEFAKKVKDIDLSKMVKDSDAIFTELDEALSFYDSMNEGEKSDCSKSFKSLDSKCTIAKSEKVKFLLEAKAKYTDEEVDGITNVLELLNIELKKALGKVNEDKSFDEFVASVPKALSDTVKSVFKKLRKDTDDYQFREDGEIYLGNKPKKVLSKTIGPDVYNFYVDTIAMVGDVISYEEKDNDSDKINKTFSFVPYE